MTQEEWKKFQKQDKDEIYKQLKQGGFPRGDGNQSYPGKSKLEIWEDELKQKAGEAKEKVHETWEHSKDKVKEKAEELQDKFRSGK